MSDEQFKRKLQLCEEVLKVLDKIMPGQSRKRGMIKYELHLRERVPPQSPVVLSDVDVLNDYKVVF